MSTKGKGKRSQEREPATKSTDVQIGDQLLLDADSEVDPVISVVMPTMNEEAGIVECIDRIKPGLREAGVTGEVIVSDDSTDRTPELSRENDAIVVEPDGEGYGYAYRYAFEQTRGEYIVKQSRTGEVASTDRFVREL
jgi:hypothetical protein